MTRRVVVTGVGLVCALGIGTDESWKNLVAGISGIGPITHFDPAAFDCKIAGEVKNFDPFRWIEKKELKKMGRFIQLALGSADAAVNLSHAGYPESVILEIANIDQLDIVSGDAVLLRLVGLSDHAVDMILHRRLRGQPTMGSAEIGRLKNTGLTEKQIMERINGGMTDAQADKEATVREAVRNHSGTGFVRLHGRR